MHFPISIGQVCRWRSARCSRAAAALAQEAPDALVKRVSQETSADDQDRSEGAGRRPGAHPRSRRDEAAAAISTSSGSRRWRWAATGGQATPEQQKQLVDQFRALLVRTYSGALAQYRDQTMDYKPLRADATATDVTVRTEVMRPGPGAGADRLQHDQVARPAGRSTTSIVGGISLVTNYRDEFNEQIKNGGIDGLIKTLTAKNQGAPAK